MAAQLPCASGRCTLDGHLTLQRLDDALQVQLQLLRLLLPRMVEINNNTMEVTRNFEYYMYGHFSKFVRTGAVRIGSGIWSSWAS